MDFLSTVKGSLLENFFPAGWDLKKIDECCEKGVTREDFWHKDFNPIECDNINDFDTYMAKVNIVKEAEIIDGKIAMSVCKEQHENMAVIAAQAADELLSITGVLASFVLCEIDNIVMISGRSMGDINVQAILEKLGGGGHLTFAGAQMAGVTVEEAKEKLLNIIEEYSIKE